MSKTFFDIETDNCGISVGGHTYVDDAGNVLVEVCDGVAIDVDTGAVHPIATFDTDDDED